MGYSLSIGEAVMDVVPEDEWGDGQINITVEEVRNDDAPAFGEPTDYTNQRWPSYTSWWNFAEFTGMENILFDVDANENIRGGHPGHFLITDMFKDAIDTAMKDYTNKYPDAVPSFEDFENRPHDGHLCRMVWLQYWVDWALENCKNPIFLNT